MFLPTTTILHDIDDVLADDEQLLPSDQMTSLFH
jgi:hypothetical protein